MSRYILLYLSTDVLPVWDETVGNSNCQSTASKLIFELQVVVKTELLNCLREEQKHSTLKKVSQSV